jgi:hypothetical protein
VFTNCSANARKVGISENGPTWPAVGDPMEGKPVFVHKPVFAPSGLLVRLTLE